MEKRKNQGQEWEDEEVIDLGEIFYAFIEGCGICFKVMANSYLWGRQYENNSSVLHQIFA